MKKLDKLYRQAPTIESPSTLDERVLIAARSRKPRPVVQPASHSRSNSRWRVAGHAISYLCIFGIGLGVLLQSGFFAGGEQAPPTIGDTSLKSDGESNIGNIRQERDADRLVGAEEGLMLKQRNSAPLVLDSHSMADNRPLNSLPADKVQQEESSRSSDVSVSLSEANIAAQSPKKVKLIPMPGSISESTASITAEVAAAPRAEVISAARLQASTESLQTSDVQPLHKTLSIEWLLIQSPNRYTIQIGDGESAANLQSIAQQLSVATELVQVNDSENGWVLLHGSFSDIEMAEDALIVLTADGIESATSLVIRYADLQRLVR